ncbi:transposase [Ktedonobacter sp. SOSP1-52]|uniref:transposase n=1 Tax=Ktedonobacter sp. SOSP1-52 TaxID=2778366 RepID=UPI001915CD49
MVKSEPRISPLGIVCKLKQVSTFRLWKTYGTEWKRHFWKEKTCWRDGYFCGTIGNTSQKIICQYIESQR